MASIVLLLSELMGCESASVLAANRYIGGQSLGEFRPAVTDAPRQSERPAETADRAGTGREEEKQAKEESFEDLAMSRIAVDVMWP